MGSKYILIMFVLVILLVVFSEGVLGAIENLDEMEVRKERMSSVTRPYAALETVIDGIYISQPASVCYSDISSNHEVWKLTTLAGGYSIAHGDLISNPWSADGKRIAFVAQQNTQAYGSSTYQRWYIMNTDGVDSRAVLAVNRIFNSNKPFFHWSPIISDVYYDFGHADSGTLNNILYKHSVTDTIINYEPWLAFTSGLKILWGAVSSDGTTIIAHGQPGGTDYYFYAAKIHPESSKQILDEDGWSLNRTFGDYGDTLNAGDPYWKPHGNYFLSKDGTWLGLSLSGTHAGWRIKVQGTESDAGPKWTEPTGSGDDSVFGEMWPENCKTIWGGTVSDPWSTGYRSHSVSDRWSRYTIFNNGNNDGDLGIWDVANHEFPIGDQSTGYDIANIGSVQHPNWNAWSDRMVASSIAGGYLDGKLHGFEWTNISFSELLCSTHTFYNNFGNYAIYFGLARPLQSPDGTKVLFHSDFLNNGTNPDIYYAVAYYPYPPEITQTTALGGTATIRFDWGLDTVNPRGYTERGWPDEDTDNPPAPRETKEFRLWRSPDSVTWTPIGTVNANPFDKFDFANGGLKTGQNSYWEITDSPGDGTWYYSVTSVEHSGLESRKLSNIYQITISGGTGTGSQSIAYPSNPGEVNNFYNSAPSSPSGFDYQATGTLGHYQLNWIEPADSMIRYYNVYYSNQGNPSAIQQQRIASLPKGTSKYLDWLADQNNPGYYGITSVDRQGNEGEIVYLVVGDDCTGICKLNSCDTYTDCVDLTGTCVSGFCCSGTCTSSSICGPADTDSDGVVSILEVMAYITEWKAGNVDIISLMAGITEWKNGC